MRQREIALGKAFYDFHIECIQKHYQDWNIGCAFKLDTFQFLNDLNEGFEVIEAHEEKNTGP